MPFTPSNTPALIERLKAAAAQGGEPAMVDGDEFARTQLANPYPGPSAPGEPPHRRTGALQDGVQHLVADDGDGVRFEQGFAREGGDPKVPLYLEYGTRRMAPRPFASVARDVTTPKLYEAVAAALRTETGN